MSVTQFAMVEELAFLVRDNLPCKHLVLSMEEALVNFLQDDTSFDEVLELEPMDAYSRLLLHRLADIFGFAHVSVGEGDNRHLILERCPETSIPSILVSDILFECDEPISLTTSHQLLRRKDAPPVLKAQSPSLHTLKDRETAYLAARERIFSVDVREMGEPVKRKPQNVPVVARRMIAHALGQKISPSNHVIGGCKGYEVQSNKLNVENTDKVCKAGSNNNKCGESSNGGKNLSQGPAEKSGSVVCSSQNGTSGNVVKKEYAKEQQMGAAKRMFAHALGRHSARGVTRCSETKQLDME